VSRFEQKGFRFVGMKFMKASQTLAEQHYAVHKGKPFYEGLVRYITSAPVLVMALEGTNAIANARAIVGATKPHEAAPGSIRGDFALEIGRNIVHASDSPENGLAEIALWFEPGELYGWSRDNDQWVFEGGR
jgi:nucleoside-diphosphate kinase